LAVVKTWLLDTGPIVAYLNPFDAAHQECAAVLDAFTGTFVTTGAILTEAMFFASDIDGGPESLAEFVQASGAKVMDCFQPAALVEAARLMRKYADTPMDFADATLVCLADDLRQYSVCTLDRRGFSVFRSASGKAFRLVLDQADSGLF
jgi:predicted nucleic acid-binding protein